MRIAWSGLWLLVVSGITILITRIVSADEKPVPQVGLDRIQRLGGTLTRDDELPGKPVTGIYFRGSRPYSSKHLPGLKSLVDLRALLFDDAQISDTGLKDVKNIRSLTFLDLGGTSVTDVGLKEVGEAYNLKSLFLYRCPRITDAGLRELRDLEELRVLDLHDTRITDIGMPELAMFENLLKLDLRRTAITDAGLGELKELESLKYLDLGGCRRITDAGVAELQEFLPRLEINRRD